MTLNLSDSQRDLIKEKLTRMVGTSDYEYIESYAAPGYSSNIEFSFTAYIPEIPEITEWVESEITPGMLERVVIQEYVPEVRYSLTCEMTYQTWVQLSDVDEYIVDDIMAQCENDEEVFEWCSTAIERFALLNAVLNIDLTSAPEIEARLRKKYAKLFTELNKHISDQIINIKIPAVIGVPQYLWLAIYSMEM